MEKLRSLLTGPSPIARLAQASVVTATLVAGFANKANAQVPPTVVSDTAGLEGADVTPESMIYLEPANGTGVLKNEISEDRRSLTVITTPNGKSVVTLHGPVQKGKYEFKVTNEGGFTKDESLKAFSYNLVKRTGDNGVVDLHVVSPETTSGDYLVVVECIPGEGATGDTEEFNIVYKPRRPGSVDTEAGIRDIPVINGSSLRASGVTVDGGLIVPVEPVSGDGLALGIGGHARARKSLSNDFSAGLHLMALDMPTDIETKDGDDKLTHRFCGNAFGEFGYNLGWGDAAVGAGYGFCEDQGGIPLLKGPEIEANVGLKLGNPNKTHGRAGVMCWAGNTLNASGETKAGWPDDLMGCGLTLDLQTQ